MAGAAPDRTPGPVEHPPRTPRPEPVPVAESPALRALARRGGDPAVWQRVAAAGGTPLVEPLGDGTHAVTFLWRDTPATREVLVFPNKVADPRDLARNLMAPLPGAPGTRALTLRMGGGWHASYTLWADEGGAPAPARSPRWWQWLPGQARPDPANPRPTLPARWTGAPQSVVRLPAAPDDADWTRRPHTPRGRFAVHTMPGGRRVWLYRAAGTAPGDRLPVAVLLDGEMWGPAMGVDALLDNLVADGALPPLAAVLPESGGSAARWAELTCRPEHVAFLAGELLPWAARTGGALTADPARTVVAGQSLGGLAAAYAVLRAPERFGGAAVQSGSFWWPTRGDGAGGEERLTAAYAAAPPHPARRLRLSAGRQEWVTLPANRRFAAAALRAGHAVRYDEPDAGHDYAAWRPRLAADLTALLGS